ncbi:MAG: hypothetical protein NZ653_09725, partial [Anaerolineae bacterium]|nr:hypothetical protein [Anaerolineae bacterium]
MRERGDAEAFLEIGDTQKQNMGHTTSGTHGKLSGRPSVPINEALRFYIPEKAPLDYARAQNSLGNAYEGLARYEEPVENLRKAISACKEALRFYTPENAP